MRRHFGFSSMILFSAPAPAEPLTFDQSLARADRYASSIAARADQTDATRSRAIAADAMRFNRDNFTMSVIGVRQGVPNIAKRRARASIRSISGGLGSDGSDAPNMNKRA